MWRIFFFYIKKSSSLILSNDCLPGTAVLDEIQKLYWTAKGLANILCAQFNIYLLVNSHSIKPIVHNVDPSIFWRQHKERHQGLRKDDRVET